jgi:hypothetical protein
MQASLIFGETLLWSLKIPATPHRTKSPPKLALGWLTSAYAAKQRLSVFSDANKSENRGYRCRLALSPTESALDDTSQTQ